PSRQVLPVRRGRVLARQYRFAPGDDDGTVPVEEAHASRVVHAPRTLKRPGEGGGHAAIDVRLAVQVEPGQDHRRVVDVPGGERVRVAVRPRPRGSFEGGKHGLLAIRTHLVPPWMVSLRSG